MSSQDTDNQLGGYDAQRLDPNRAKSESVKKVDELLESSAVTHKRGQLASEVGGDGLTSPKRIEVSPQCSPATNFPAGLALGLPVTPDDAQIASMSLRAAPVDVRDGGDYTTEADIEVLRATLKEIKDALLTADGWPDGETFYRSTVEQIREILK